MLGFGKGGQCDSRVKLNIDKKKGKSLVIFVYRVIQELSIHVVEILAIADQFKIPQSSQQCLKSLHNGHVCQLFCRQ